VTDEDSAVKNEISGMGILIKVCTNLTFYSVLIKSAFFNLAGQVELLKIRQNRNDQADVSSKKQSNEFNFTTMIPQADLFSFVFLEEIEDTKKTFRN
jgi:hypothetical protein